MASKETRGGVLPLFLRGAAHGSLIAVLSSVLAESTANVPKVGTPPMNAVLAIKPLE